MIGFKKDKKSLTGILVTLEEIATRYPQEKLSKLIKNIKSTSKANTNWKAIDEKGKFRCPISGL